MKGELGAVIERLAKIGAGKTINGTYQMMPIPSYEAFRGDLTTAAATIADLTAQLDKAREALERPTEEMLIAGAAMTDDEGDARIERARGVWFAMASACLPATSGDGAATHPDHPFEDLSDALAACERIRDESTHAQSLPEGYLLGFRAGSNGCVVALLNLIGFRTRALAPKGLQL